MSSTMLTRRSVGVTVHALRAFALSLPFLLAGCGGGGGSDSTVTAKTSSDAATTPSATTAQTSVALSQPAQLGQKIFSDASLSASGRQSCASCHDPASAHAAPNDLSVQLGGPDMTTPGFRASPSLRYLNSTPAFFFAADGTPTGGFNHDGRAQTLAVQAQRPFLAPHEMANASKADVIDKLKRTAYAEEFRTVFGAAIFDDADAAFDRATFALQQFEKEDPAFHPFDAKYDAFLAGRAQLSDAELRGLALFNNPAKGNCAACHPSAKGADGSSPLFTDFTYDNLGVPRNAAIPATADAAYFDFGLCGPDRTDLTARQDLCGAFKVPTLRNVATRRAFFHNGAFHTLRDALRFYVRRDTNPEEWYPLAANGSVDKFNDLPPELRGNVNTSEAPYNRKPGMAPALSEAEIDDLIAFLNTLNDGYRP
ncbi:cytochrome-c peroxidase [Noviherbaspirillum pedocola]|uniref:C-type cytochrome n=1 Tax=Noviherbaspirillum pedocola TaxID=2801341 RepID=A0A934SWJ6_9BURK|nr:cytochrome c peroxidase [Noviherbaspirillum pedocola]MBK4736416.1 c-type cytochrome [Noviherbaspirillum pedocola]